VRQCARQRSIRICLPRASDARAHGADRGRWQTGCGHRALDVRCERGESDGGWVSAEDRVDVLEERVADDPRDLAAAAAALRSVKLEESAETLAVRQFGQLKVVRRNGPTLAAEGQGDVNGGRAG
jgi:hypothetical protein